MRHCVEIDIMEKKWRISRYSKSYFRRKVGAGTAGLCSFPDRQIYLSAEFFDIETVLHEVMHAYMFECHSSGTQLTTEQVEELACEIVGERVTDVIYTAVSIYRKLGGKKIKLRDLHESLEKLEKLWDTN